MAALNFPTITFDNEKCTVPFYCKKCLEACPSAVLVVIPLDVKKGRETNPQDSGAYAMGATHTDKCIGCNDCVELCPEDAITITFPN